MASFKEPSFQERMASAGQARNKALEKLRTKPALDPAEVEQRRAAFEAKEAKAAALRAEKKEARERAIAERKAAALEAATEAASKQPKKLTPEEQKAARDARYAARKKRVSGR